MLNINEKLLRGLRECGIDTAGILDRSLEELLQIIKERGQALAGAGDLKNVNKLLTLESMIISRNYPC